MTSFAISGAVPSREPPPERVFLFPATFALDGLGHVPRLWLCGSRRILLLFFRNISSQSRLVRVAGRAGCESAVGQLSSLE